MVLLGKGNEISWVRSCLGTNQFGYEPVWVRTSLGTKSPDFMRMHGMAGLMVCILQDCIFTHGEKGVKGHNCRQHS